MKLQVLALILVVLLAGTVLAEEFPAPDRHDWSKIHALFTVPRSQMLPPVRTDSKGNFHAFYLNTESSMLSYATVDSSGQLIADTSVHLPNVGSNTKFTGIPDHAGLNVVWATPDDEGYWRLYICKVDSQGIISDPIPLAYNLSTPHRVLHSSDLDLMRSLTHLDGAIDSAGRLHLSLRGGLPREIRSLYMRFDSNYQFELIRRSGPGTMYPRSHHSGGQLLLDKEDNAYILNDYGGVMTLDCYAPDGTRSIEASNVGTAVYDMGDPSGTLYTARRVGPVMAIDDEGVIHLAYNYLTQPPRLTPHIVDVAYVQVKGGEVILEKIITNKQGVSHYPTITTNGGKVYIAWEETSGSAYELFYSVLNTEGEILSHYNRLTWEHLYSRLGYVFGDDQGHLHAFWWRPGRGQDRLAYKNTADPMPNNVLLRLGLDPYDLDSSLASQVIYYGIMVLVTGIGQVVANLHLMLYVIALLFVIYKLQVLDLLLERPWTFFLILLVVLYPIMPTVSAPETAFPLTQGFQFFVWLIGVVLTGSILLLLKIKPNSTLNLMLGCLIWMLLTVLIQMVPVVPHAFAL